MFDSHLRKLIEPPLNTIGRGLASKDICADHVTLLGGIFALILAVLLAFGQGGSGVFLLFGLNRLCDGVDGAIARARGKTDFGGYLDIFCDFIFYGAVPFAFVLRDGAANGTAAAFLLMAFYINGASYFGFALLAKGRNLQTIKRGEKSYYASYGLMEGGETIAFFALMILFPGYFPPLAWIFGVLCLVTALLRLNAARAECFGGNEFQ